MVQHFHAHLHECPLLSFNCRTTGVSVCYCPLSDVRLLLKDIGHPYAPLFEIEKIPCGVLTDAVLDRDDAQHNPDLKFIS